MMNPDNPPDPPPDVERLGFVCFAALVFVMSAVLLWFSHLREDTLFWRNSGGYPVPLRETVKFSYYPLFLLSALGAFVLSMGLLARIGPSWTRWCLRSVVVTVCWAMIITSFLMAFGDNVHNIWIGRPLHDERPF